MDVPQNHGGLYLLGGLIKNEIFYPWMGRNLSISQNGEIFAKFNEANERLDIFFQTPGVDVVICVLEGEEEIVAGEEKFVAKKNDLIVVPKRRRRGVKGLQ